MKAWVIELIGSMIFVAAWIWTHANPYVVGLAYIGIMLIGAPVTGGHFSPLITGSQWALGQIEGVEAAQYVLAQISGAALAVVASPMLDLTGKPLH
jgi:glycerol uptake facilitator-like aquaporin